MTSSEPARVIVGDLPVPDDDFISPSSYQTARLCEFHEVGADGRPARHRTVQTIRALRDGVTTHRYSFDLSQARVDSIRGGTPGDPYRVKGSLWAVELTLPKPLRRFEEHTLEYVTTFRGDGPVEPYFRRAAHRRVENAAIKVTFHPEMLPARVWWAQWADYREPHDHLIERAEVAVDPAHSVSHQVAVLERAVAGFVWEFEAWQPSTTR